MEFVCRRDDLAKGIATVERAVSTRESMPVLEGILITARGDRLHLVATDLELSIESYVPARIEAEGAAVLSGKVFGQIVRKLEGEDVVYRTGGKGIARIESGRSQFTVHTMPDEDFPALPEVDESQMWRIGQGSLRRMIRQTAFAAASDDARPFLTGVLIEVEGDQIRMVATDSSRLAYREGTLLEPAAEKASGIVPVRTLLELLRILDSDDESEVAFSVSRSQAVFRMAGTQVISRVIDGQFPNYRGVFPGEQPTKIRLDRDQFLAAVERVSLVARRNTPVVKLKFSEDTLFLSSREAEVGEAYEEIPARVEGPGVETAYQSRYLTDLLRAVEGDEILIELGDGLKQGKISPADQSDYVYIVMPVRVG